MRPDDVTTSAAIRLRPGEEFMEVGEFKPNRMALQTVPVKADTTVKQPPAPKTSGETEKLKNLEKSMKKVVKCQSEIMDRLLRFEQEEKLMVLGHPRPATAQPTVQRRWNHVPDAGPTTAAAPRDGRSCYTCHEVGHIAARCPVAALGDTRTCYNCHQVGHIAAKCPQSAAQNGNQGN